MTPVYDRPAEVAAFVERGVFRPGEHFANYKAIGFADKGELVAGFVYHNWNPAGGTIEVSGYSTRRDWVSKSLLRVIFEYPFEQVKCRAVVARHSEHNKRVIRIWKALGATQTRIPELRGPAEAEVIALLTRDAWLKSKFMR